MSTDTPEPQTPKGSLSPFEAAFQITLGILSAIVVAAIVVGVVGYGLALGMFTVKQAISYVTVLLGIGILGAGVLVGLMIVNKLVEGWRARRSVK